LPKQARKNLERIDARYRKRIMPVLASLAQNPYIGKKLEGEYKGEWSYTVWPYRIIYRIRARELIVLIIRIRHRQGAYK